MARQSLGKGIDSLIPKDLDRAILEEDQQRIQKLLIDEVSPNPDQPRREFDEQSLVELAASVKRHGVLQPIIVVRSRGQNSYKIVAGERRWRAAKLAGLQNIPAIVRSLAELEQIELSLVENIQRSDLSPLDQAMSLYKLQQQFNMSLEDIAKKLGKATSTISNLIRLLQLPEATRKALSEGKISEGHARAVLALKHKPSLQEQLLNSILDNGWNVRQAEQFVKDVRKSKISRQLDQPTPSQSQFARSMSQKLGFPVAVKRSVRGGKIVISFKSDSDLDKILNKFSG